MKFKRVYIRANVHNEQSQSYKLIGALVLLSFVCLLCVGVLNGGQRTVRSSSLTMGSGAELLYVWLQVLLST